MVDLVLKCVLSELKKNFQKLSKIIIDVGFYYITTAVLGLSNKFIYSVNRDKFRYLHLK